MGSSSFVACWENDTEFRKHKDTAVTRQSLTNTAFAGRIENGTVLDLPGRSQKDVSLQEASAGKSLSLFSRNLLSLGVGHRCCTHTWCLWRSPHHTLETGFLRASGPRASLALLQGDPRGLWQSEVSRRLAGLIRARGLRSHVKSQVPFDRDDFRNGGSRVVISSDE